MALNKASDKVMLSSISTQVTDQGSQNDCPRMVERPSLLHGKQDLRGGDAAFKQGFKQHVIDIWNEVLSRPLCGSKTVSLLKRE